MCARIGPESSDLEHPKDSKQRPKAPLTGDPAPTDRQVAEER